MLKTPRRKARRSRRRNSHPSATGAGFLAARGLIRRLRPHALRGWRPKSRLNAPHAACLDISKPEIKGSDFLNMSYPPALIISSFEMILRPQSPASSLSHFLLTEVSSLHCDESQDRGKWTPPAHPSKLQPVLLTGHTSGLPLPASLVLDPRNGLRLLEAESRVLG